MGARLTAKVLQRNHIFRLDIIRHPNQERYPGQSIIVLNVEGYVWLVPYVKSRGVRFLKAIIPSRKATREYLR